jgi:ferrous iron transport protein B
MEKNYTIALIGNQNSGKTTLFNRLTGSNQHVGNFPGVTVEKKEGTIKKRKNITVVDLPGIYSLSPYSVEEIVTRNFLLNAKPDIILNIADATNIERNLYLTLQLLELEMPMVLALNMIDEVLSSGNYIDVKEMERQLNIPVVPISAAKNQGISELLEAVAKSCEEKKGNKYDFCSGEVHKAIHSVIHIIEDRAKEAALPVRFAATKLIEGETELLPLTDKEKNIISKLKESDWSLFFGMLMKVIWLNPFAKRKIGDLILFKTRLLN